MTLLRSFIFTAVVVLSLSAASVSTAADAPPAEEQSMADFIRNNPGCLEFNDQCSICAMVDGRAECSTPRIACVKKPYVCTRRADK
ncbi:hypothetical protein AM571_CH02770 [Rhizobium etli 8C-3]|uniref:Uncharacterized protein n=2 Tax=Rhizobium TaxID=379 RepID=A0A4R3QLC2_9HYPH|nr:MULTISPECIES: hypothetical protein [Rhizobium]APO75575.1 hypothetical protein AM571_CH02770 [Rhizobium etli 8C-3]TCU21944.1 hypothetical protein EV130_110289 [Rhizobium azibense]TCU33253.1 hypothetical protein EV129_11611 [Rhizobium azibense]